MMKLVVPEEHLDEKYPADEKKYNLTGQNYDRITQQLHYCEKCSVNISDEYAIVFYDRK